MKNIKNIIFDLGGVFIEIDYQKTEDAFIELGVTNFKELYNQHHASDLFKKLETGQLNEQEFYEAFTAAAQVKLKPVQIKNAWNAMLGKFYVENIQWLNDLKNKFNVYLFSNTNIIHYNAFVKIYQDQTGEESFDDCFIKAYYSHDLHQRKPDTESYQAILQKENISAAETLFIDDTLKNIEGAKAAGLQTFHLIKPKDLINISI